MVAALIRSLACPLETKWPKKAGTLFVVLAVSFVIAACDSNDRPPTVPPPIPTTAPPTERPRLYGPDTVWDRYSHQERVSLCFSGGDIPACIRTVMADTGASASALRFFDETGTWLLEYQEGSPIGVGRALPWSGRDVGPTLAFLNGSQDFAWVIDVFRPWFEVTSDHPERAFEEDPLYATLVSAFPPTSESKQYGLWLFPSEEALLESISTLPSGEEEIVIQVGIRNGCVNCGTGIAERYAFYFTPDGRLRDIKLLGLCEGRSVTRTAPLDGRPFTLQQFGTITFTDLEGVEECPPQLPI